MIRRLEAVTSSGHTPHDDRDREAQSPTSLENPPTFRESVHRILNVLERIGMDHNVEAARRIGKCVHIDFRIFSKYMPRQRLEPRMECACLVDFEDLKFVSRRLGEIVRQSAIRRYCISEGVSKCYGAEIATARNTLLALLAVNVMAFVAGDLPLIDKPVPKNGCEAGFFRSANGAGKFRHVHSASFRE